MWTNKGKWGVVKQEESQTSNWPANNESDIIKNFGMFKFIRNGEGWSIESDVMEAVKMGIIYAITGDKIKLYHTERMNRQFLTSIGRDTVLP